MPRLIDDIRAIGALSIPYFVKGRMVKSWWRLANELWPMLTWPELPVVAIDAELAYYFEGTDQEEWNIRTDFPSLRPPYRCYWAEGVIPKRIISRASGVTDLAVLVPHGRIGFLVNTLSPDAVVAEDIPNETYSILWVELFIDYGNGRRAQGPHGPVFMVLDAGGDLIGNAQMHSLAGSEDLAIMDKYIIWLHPLLLSMSSARERMKA